MMLLINFKTYPQAIGPNALKLTHELLGVARRFPHVKVGFAPPALDLAEVAEHTQAQIWAQHVDLAGVGQFTGFLSPKDAKAAGAWGTFLNHSEHPLDNETTRKTASWAKDSGLKVLIFARDPLHVAQFSKLAPDFIAYEPPELIGGRISVTTAKPQIIEAAVKESSHIPLLVGAGVHEGKDVEVAVRLGAKGVVVSSAIVTARNPRGVLEEMLKAFPR